MGESIDTDDVRALSAAATPGPWTELSRSIWSEEHGRSVALTTKQADAALIVWLRNHADALVAAVRWAQDAPHHQTCGWCSFGPCTCGRDKALAPFEADR